MEKVRVSSPQAVERTLTELRRAALSSAGPARPVVRAMAVNLIAHAHTPAQAEEMAAQAASLAERHPSRTIILGGQPQVPSGEWDIHLWARCQPAVPALVVCFEAIQIVAGVEAMQRLPAVALSLLLRDLPVYLWWPGDLPVSSPLFERLLANSDRLVIDSAAAGDSEALLRQAASLGPTQQGEGALSDLNWGRLTPWRELTAEFFDPPDCRPCLERLERVRLEFAGAPGPSLPAQAYLLVAWLATRLGWAAAPVAWRTLPAGGEIDLLRGRQPVTAEVAWGSAPAEGSLLPAELRRLVLHAGHEEGRATLSAARSPDGTYASLTTSLPNRPAHQRTVPFPSLAPADLLGDELGRSGYDAVYQQALRMAALLAARGA